jgi:hypothetical protein
MAKCDKLLDAAVAFPRVHFCAFRRAFKIAPAHAMPCRFLSVGHLDTVLALAVDGRI